MIGSSVNRNDHQEKLWEIKDNFFRLDEGAKIVDAVAGKHYVAVCSSNGKVYASSHRFYHYHRDSRSNTENSESCPYELRMPEGYKAQKLWPHEKYNTLFVNCTDVDGKTKTFAGGQER